MHRLEARNVSKTFGSTKVLHDVGLRVAPGEIHALIGQNGSGKSTVVKILTGYHAPDAGASLTLDGRQIPLPVQWRRASELGISVVHQDLGLLDQLTVSDNIGIGGYRHSRFLRRIDWRRQAEIARDVLARLDVDIDPQTPVAALSATRRAEVAIARALREHTPGTGLIILDEATRALPREELVKFHALLRRVVAEGTSVLMVSHNLEEVRTLADRVTVLRDGTVAGAGLPTADLSEQDMARLMLGKTVGTLSPRGVDAADRPPVAVVTGLTGDGLGEAEVSLEVREGEVVGLTGLPGSGFEAIPYLITGARRAGGGTLRTDAGELPLDRATVAQCMAAGVSLVPERRERDGLAFELSIRDNIALPSVRSRGKPWFVRRGWQDAQADELIGKLAIRTRSSATLVKELSGGNQQKVLFAKWLSLRPRLLVLHEATQAVDVGARQDLLTAIHEVADTGVGVLYVSGEPSDLADVCDRILVHRPGQPFLELRDVTADAVLDAIYAGTTTAGGSQCGNQ
ncbi:sugar ABC transporter ATP-binding protein [Thermopolyspora sp. NPDC052614]|uniref:sugar ABC transporter ATP-binding protein n=1 Tax=Thermopolyspora sp. NPDC052614 TaxID=3155682 RepID=UPI003447769E